MTDGKPPSRFARLAAIGGLTGRVTTTYVRQRLSDVFSPGQVGREVMDRLHIDNAKDVVATMSRLKGAAMKLGQQVAMFAEHMDLPEEVGQVFATLHAEATPLPFSSIQATVERELERPLTEAFSFFDPNPLGTASLAQAHLARLPDGREVVVKVLHEGVEKSVDTDLATLKTLLVTGRVLRRTAAEIDDIFDEIRDRLREELDYLQEAANLVAYEHTYGNDPRVRIPRSHSGWSTERVLTMDRLPGVPLDVFVSTASPEAKARAGATLTAFYYEQVFIHRTLHADPHPGNYLFEVDGRVGVLDFGCVKRFDPYWIGTYGRTALALLDHDKEAALQGAIALGAWDGRDPEAGHALWRMLLGMVRAFDHGEVAMGVAGETLLEDMQPLIRGLIPFPDVRAPRHVIMLHRALGGLYALSRRLNTRADFGAILRAHAQHAVDVAEGRPS